MMAIEINLTAEDIDKLVNDSVREAGFGKAIEDGVKRAISQGKWLILLKVGIDGGECRIMRDHES
jgi:hypothetical protein